jgi:hypothetical protein
VNVTFAIDGDFDAGRSRPGPVCENQCDAPECPSFSINLHNGVPLTNAKWFIRSRWHAIAFSEELADNAHQVASEQNTKRLLIHLLEDMGCGGKVGLLRQLNSF